MTDPTRDDLRHTAERMAEARWQALVNSAVDGIIVIDSRGLIETFNAAAEIMFGYGAKEVLGRNITMLMTEPDRSRHDAHLGQYLETGDRRVIGIGRQVTGQRRDGSSFPVHLSVGEIEVDGEKHFTGILHDLSRRTELEERLRDASALARLGEMAAVIAHEVKNPLAAVRGAIQVIGGRMPAGTQDAAIIGEIIMRLDALNDLIQDLLVFARPPKPRLILTDLGRLLRSTSELLRKDPALAKQRIEFEGDSPVLVADPNLLAIAFQNLFINAAQAMNSRGMIRVRTSTGGGWHLVEVIDQGPGIPPEVRARLFRPFHTTKSRGTGLGLATARKLVDLHGGRISVECPPSGGTVVKVELPSGPTEPGVSENDPA